jgi:hypothetical protein
VSPISSREGLGAGHRVRSWWGFRRLGANRQHRSAKLIGGSSARSECRRAPSGPEAMDSRPGLDKS